MGVHLCESGRHAGMWMARLEKCVRLSAARRQNCGILKTLPHHLSNDTLTGRRLTIRLMNSIRQTLVSPK